MKFLLRNTLPRLLFLSVSLGVQAERLDRVVAIVGEQPILRSDVLNFKNELSSNKTLANIYRVDPSKLGFKDLLNRIIEEKIVQQAAKDADLSVADSEVEAQIASIAKQNRLSKAALVEQLKGQGIAYESYKRNIRSQIEKRNIFDREIRKGGSSVGESELRMVYNQRAETEVKLSLYSLKKTPANKKNLLATLEKIKSGNLSLEKLVDDPATTSLDWTAVDSLQKPLQKALSGAKLRQAVGPVDLNGYWHLVLFEAQRKGSEEDFQKTKGELMMAAQNQDLDRRFDLWLERKKKDMQIVVNEI